MCSCKQMLTSEPRKKHNATQTPTSLINSDLRSRKKASFCYEKHYSCLPSMKKRDYCNCAEVRRCQLHFQHNVTPTSRCCCLATHHNHYSCHQHAGIMPVNKEAIDSFKRHKRCSSGRHNRPLHVYHQHKKHCSSEEHLPNTCTKSSLDSSDDQNHRLSSSVAMQEIAIEIDAATMTEDNTTTATSNFAFNVAVEPIIRAPVHVDSDDGGRRKRLARRLSLNSNTSVETDELSNEEVIDNEMGGYNSRGQCYCHCCNHTLMKDSLPISPMENECVKIKRKRFITADDYCSTCSKCSSCSCSHVQSSSCSSFEEWPLEGQHSVRSAPHCTHALTVSADCPHCHLQRQISRTSTEDVQGQIHGFKSEEEEEFHPLPLVPATTDSSARTSRRSSVSNSFCSCNSNTCCYYSGSYEDSHTDHMCTARDATIASLTLGKLGPFEIEEGHSSTLTPLTNPSSAISTPGDEGDVTIRSFSNAFSEDTSSQSHSAEYFSLSSANQVSQGTPRKLPIKNDNLSTPSCSKGSSIGVPKVSVIDTSTNTAPILGDEANASKLRKPCKHYKHHRHKHIDLPVDSYL